MIAAMLNQDQIELLHQPNTMTVEEERHGEGAEVPSLWL